MYLSNTCVPHLLFADSSLLGLSKFSGCLIDSFAWPSLAASSVSSANLLVQFLLPVLSQTSLISCLSVLLFLLFFVFFQPFRIPSLAFLTSFPFFKYFPTPCTYMFLYIISSHGSSYLWTHIHVQCTFFADFLYVALIPLPPTFFLEIIDTSLVINAIQVQLLVHFKATKSVP